jgi:hypothetical protein
MRAFRRFVVLWIGIALAVFPLQAKRVRPKEVPPIFVNGVKYSAEGNGRDAFVVATDVRSGSVLGKVKIFHIRIKPWIEEDNHWIFISDLKMAHNTLFIRSENGRCFSLDVPTRRVKKGPCDKSPDSPNG